LQSLPLLLVVVACAASSADDWPWWRGPSFNGVAPAGQHVPTHWSETRNVLWKVRVPGRGHASPTVSGEHVYLATADEQAQTQGVLCLSRRDGERLWLSTLSRGGFPKTHPKNTHATPTVACDGERLFTVFHHHQRVTLYCLDRSGAELWSRNLGRYDPQRYEYGYAPSPLIVGDLVIVAAEVEHGSFLAACRRSDGVPVWRTVRPSAYSLSSPIVARLAGRDQVLMSGHHRIVAYDPRDGEELWSTPGASAATCGTVVWDGDLVFASGGFPESETVCVRAEGDGQVLWKNGSKCYEQSMLATNGYLYAVTDAGVAYCWRGLDGEEMWRKRLQGPISSSPILAGDTIYSTNEAGTTYVFKADPERYVPVAENQLGAEGFATMSVCGNRIYIRTATGSGAERQEWLYCLGE
jgi:outer membrane protein assembly factor BamB